MSDDARKRRESRLTINKEFGSFEAFIEEYVTNISRSGAFVKTSDPPPLGSEINLKFTVIMEDIETIEGVGKVVRVQDDPPGMGVVFTRIDHHSQHLLERLLTAGHTNSDKTPS
jgi:Tfp pilus assembly protein PilZ